MCAARLTRDASLSQTTLPGSATTTTTSVTTTTSTMSISDLVMHRLVETEPTRIVGTEEREEARLIRVHRLDAIDPGAPIAPCTPELRPAEQLLLNKMYNTPLCKVAGMMNILFFDLQKHLASLLRFVPKNMHSVSQKQNFLVVFITGYIGLQVISMQARDREKLLMMRLFDRKNAASSNGYCALSPTEFALCLEAINGSIKDELKHIRATTIHHLLISFEDKIKLVCKLIRHPNAYTFLCDHNILTLNTSFKSLANRDFSPRETVIALPAYARFIADVFAMPHPFINFNIHQLVDLPRYLDTLPVALHQSSKQRYQAVLAVKRKFGEFLEKAAYLSSMYLSAWQEAERGELSQEQFLKNCGASDSWPKKSQQEFLDYLWGQMTGVHVLREFVMDVLLTLDQHVLHPLFPTSHISIYKVFDRINVLITSLPHIHTRTTHIEDFSAHLPPSLSSAAGPDRCRNLFISIGNIDRQIKQLTARCIPGRETVEEILCIYETKELGMRREYSEYEDIFTRLIPPLDNLSAVLDELDELRKSCLQEIRQFLYSLPSGTLVFQREEWYDFFQNLLVKQTTDLLCLCILAKDIPAARSLHFEYTDEELIPSKLSNFISLEGFNDAIPYFKNEPSGEGMMRVAACGLQPMREDPKTRHALPVVPAKTAPIKRAFPQPVEGKGIAAAPTTPPVKRAVSTSLASTSSSSSKTMDDTDSLTFRRGMKTRQVLALLKQRGILPNRSSGLNPHRKLMMGWKRVGTTPGGSRADTIPIGTLRSVMKQVIQTTTTERR